MAKVKMEKDEEYPSNSNRLRNSNVRSDDLDVPPKSENKTPRPRTIIKAVKRKRSFAQRVAGIFAGETGHNIIDFALHEVFVPAAKSTIQELVTTTMEMLLNGTGYSTSPRERRDDRGHVSYDRYFVPDRREAKPSRSRSRRFDLDDITFRDHNDAEDVLDEMCEEIEEYGRISVSAYCSLAGVDGVGWVGNNWGWKDLSKAYCTYTRGGWGIVLPDPIELGR